MILQSLFYIRDNNDNDHPISDCVKRLYTCLSLVLLLGPEPGLQRAPRLQEGLPLLALGEVFGVGARPVDGEVDHKQRGHRVE